MSDIEDYPGPSKDHGEKKGQDALGGASKKWSKVEDSTTPLKAVERSQFRIRRRRKRQTANGESPRFSVPFRPSRIGWQKNGRPTG
jgi:hypothetical protein